MIYEQYVLLLDTVTTTNSEKMKCAILMRFVYKYNEVEGSSNTKLKASRGPKHVSIKPL